MVRVPRRVLGPPLGHGGRRGQLLLGQLRGRHRHAVLRHSPPLVLASADRLRRGDRAGAGDGEHPLLLRANEAGRGHQEQRRGPQHDPGGDGGEHKMRPPAWRDNDSLPAQLPSAAEARLPEAAQGHCDPARDLRAEVHDGGRGHQGRRAASGGGGRGPGGAARGHPRACGAGGKNCARGGEGGAGEGGATGADAGPQSGTIEAERQGRSATGERDLAGRAPPLEPPRGQAPRADRGAGSQRGPLDPRRGRIHKGAERGGVWILGGFLHEQSLG
mmetsp:Transcript_49777/g.133256  ORF Transcript_49777/g.133256 Transcript_49777/m.133256 type:complete len:274 (+) Transcript_49777:340-1161(+)